MSDFGWRLWLATLAGDFGWRLSDYDRPPSFRVEVRRFFDLLAAGGAGGWRGWRLAGTMFTINLDFLLRLRLTSKCKYDILQLHKGSKCKSIQRQAAGRKGEPIMIIYPTRYQARKNATSGEIVVKVCGGYAVMTFDEYRIWKGQK